MTMTGLEVFDSTIHTTNVWLKEIMEELHWEDRQKAYAALRAVLHVLRDRLIIEEAADLGAQLPMLIRGFYYEGWKPAGKPVKARRKEEFLAAIREYFMRSDPNIDSERVAQAVFKVLDRRISDGEIQDIKHVLPEDVVELWPKAA